jgi:hypothetical protein
MSSARRILGFLAVLFVFAACATPSRYSVPEEEWARMSEAQRTEAIRGYNERELLREEARLRDAERRAIEARAKAEREQAEERQRQDRIEAIRHGDAGQWGDLIRVSLQGGEMRLGNRHRAYAPVSVSLADGETRTLDIFSDEPRQTTYRGNPQMSYTHGRLTLDKTHLVFEPAWRNGRRYLLDSQGALDLRGVEVTVMVVPERR